MTIELTIDADRRLVIATAHGGLQLPDITEYFARLVAGRTLGYRKIFDGRSSWLELTDRQLALLSENVGAMKEQGPRGPLAIVATTPRGITGANFFMGIPAPDRASRLFDTIEAAMVWLDSKDAHSAAAAARPPKLSMTPGLARQRAAQARRLAGAVLSADDCDRLIAYARELEEQASMLEAEAR